jgi:ribosomal protein S24E
MNRTEITVEIHHQGEPTPKRLELKKVLAAKLGTKEDLVAIKKIESSFSSKTTVYANLYSKKEDLEKLEPKYIAKRLEKAQKKSEEKSKKAAEAKVASEEKVPAETAEPEKVEEKPASEEEKVEEKPAKEQTE